MANAAFASANNVGPQIAPAFNTANASFGKANTALQNTSGTLSGNFTVTGNVSYTGAIYSSGVKGQVVPSGANVIFQQTAAPTGFTKVTTYNDYAMRIVNGSVANKTNGVAFTTAFASQSVTGSLNSVSVTGTVDDTTLASSQMPAHKHTSGFAGVNSSATYGVNPGVGNGNINGQSGQSGANHPYTSTEGGGGSHNHTFTSATHGHTFTGTSINMAVNYVDFILTTAN